MGLFIDVGGLGELRDDDEDAYNWQKQQFASINRVLTSLKRPLHHEPESPVDRWSGDLMGYSSLHYLRRIAAHAWAGKKLPAPGTDDAVDDPILKEYYDRSGQPFRFWHEVFGVRSKTPPRFAHLIMHSDSDGYYLPIDFPNVIVSDESLQIAGCMIGSSQRLKAECEELASLIGVPLDVDADSEELIRATRCQGKSNLGWKSYGVESFVCLRLWRAACTSIRSKAAIVFC